MAEFTREQLIERARENVESLKFASTQHAFEKAFPAIEIDIRLAEIALAALTADASMYASEETLICAEQGEFLLRTLNRPAGDATIPLYRLPPLEGLK